MLAAQAILPIFALIVLGYLLGWRQWLTAESAAGLANITFKLFMPTLLFAGIAKAPLAQGLIKLNGHDARGHGNDGVARNHGAGGDGLTQTRLRDKIPVAHGGEGHNGPVHGDGNAREAMLGPLNDVQQRGKDRNQGHNREQKDEDLPPRTSEGRDQ